MGAWLLLAAMLERLGSGLLGAHAEGAALALAGGGMFAASFLPRARAASTTRTSGARS